MLTIRLARAGRNKYPTYRVVAAESARAATGKFVAVLGHYNPHTKELVLQREAIQTHLGHGAQPSNTVIKLLQREKIELPAWVQLKTKQSKPKKAPAETEAAPAAVASAPAEAESVETPEAQE
jgi:small subunit ribosomal protein S16